MKLRLRGFHRALSRILFSSYSVRARDPRAQTIDFRSQSSSPGISRQTRKSSHSLSQLNAPATPLRIRNPGQRLIKSARSLHSRAPSDYLLFLTEIRRHLITIQFPSRFPRRRKLILYPVTTNAFATRAHSLSGLRDINKRISESIFSCNEIHYRTSKEKIG